MKKLFSTLAAVAVLVALVIFSSCSKDQGKIPNIAFETGVMYTSSNKTVNAHDTLFVSIIASKSESGNKMKTFTVKKSVDGGTATTVTNVTLSGANGDNYTTILPLVAGNGGHTETWSYTVTTEKGSSNSVSFTLTVN